jgi:hypothetical protein
MRSHGVHRERVRLEVAWAIQSRYHAATRELAFGTFPRSNASLD